MIMNNIWTRKVTNKQAMQLAFISIIFICKQIINLLQYDTYLAKGIQPLPYPYTLNFEQFTYLLNIKVGQDNYLTRIQMKSSIWLNSCMSLQIPLISRFTNTLSEVSIALLVWKYLNTLGSLTNMD